MLFLLNISLQSLDGNLFASDVCEFTTNGKLLLTSLPKCPCKESNGDSSYCGDGRANRFYVSADQSKNHIEVEDKRAIENGSVFCAVFTIGILALIVVKNLERKISIDKKEDRQDGENFKN